MVVRAKVRRRSHVEKGSGIGELKGELKGVWPMIGVEHAKRASWGCRGLF